MKYCFDMMSQEECQILSIREDITILCPKYDITYDRLLSDVLLDIIDKPEDIRLAVKQDLKFGTEVYIQSENFWFKHKIRKQKQEEYNIDYKRYLNQIIALIKKDLLWKKNTMEMEYGIEK